MVLVLERPNNYRYDRVAPEDGSFRLLEVLPASSVDAILECRLHPAHIERAANTYAALSYQWGAPGRGLVIRLDGEEFRIQRNLWLFLCQLRRYNHLYLWVDAICINQNDLVERGQQVQLMNRIYPSAATVLVWLGEEGDNSDPAFTFLQHVDHSHDTHAVQNTPKIYRSLFGDEDEAHVWAALQKLCERDYWTRLWIIQEVLLARELIIFCGNRTLSWNAFKYACAGPASVRGFTGLKMADSVFGPVHGAKMAMSKSQFRELSHQRALQRPRYLRQLIEAYGTAQCTDIRDRIYGLLGMARDWSQDDGIDIDYSRTELSLLVDIMCSSHIGQDASKFGLLLIHVLKLDQNDGGFSTVFGQALFDDAQTNVGATAGPMVSSNAPWMESPTFELGDPISSARALSSNTLSLARHTYHKIDIALRRKITAVYPSGFATTRFSTSRSEEAYAHVAVQVGDLIFSMPDTAIGLIYRPSSDRTLQYVGWAIPEAALNQLDPFWVSDEGIDASLRFLMGLGRDDLEVKLISETLNLDVQVSIWDLLFLLTCSPNGYHEAEKRKPIWWWGKPLPLQPASSCFELSFTEPDPKWDRKSRSLRY